MTPQLAAQLVVGFALASTIFVFFWSMDSVRRERTTTDEIIAQLPRRRRSRVDVRDAVDRLMQPLADVLSERQRRAGKVTLAEELARAGLRWTSSEYLLVQVSLAMVLALGTLYLTGPGVQVLLAGWAGYIGPHFYMRSRQAKRQREFAGQLGNTLTLLSNALKTGYSLVQALEVLAQKAPAPVSDEFEVVITSIHFGASIEDALAALVKRVNSPDLDFIVIAVLLHRKVGGNLPEILDTIADTIRDRLRMKREMAVLTAHARASSTLISALPLVLGAFMYAITPRYFRPMLESPIGWVLLALAASLVVLGNVLMRRLSQVEN